MQFGTSDDAHRYLKKYSATLIGSEKTHPSRIVKINDGFHNFVFSIYSGNRKYIGKLSREDQENNLDKEFNALRFLESQGFRSVPKIVSYEVNTVLITTFLGEIIPYLSDKILISTAHFLANLHSIPIEAYNANFDTKYSSVDQEGELLQRNFNEYTREVYDRYCNLTSTIHKDVKKLYVQGSKHINGLIQKNKKTTFTCIHGDPNIGNLRLVEDAIGMIDWELFRVGSQMSELAYVIAENELDTRQTGIFLTNYKKHLRGRVNINYDELMTRVKLSYLNHLLWSALKYEEALKANDSEMEVYKKMFEHRLRRTTSAWE